MYKVIKQSLISTFLTISFSFTAFAQDIVVTPLDAKPTLDGEASEWASISETTIPLTGKGGVDSVKVKAGIFDNEIYFLVVWADKTPAKYHKPYEWDAAANEYKRSRAKEDRLALAFPIAGDFSNNHAGPNIFTSDVWHWKAARSNPAGLAHDKSHITSSEETKKSKKLRYDGGIMYLSRPSDSGDKLYTANKPSEKTEDVVSSYKINETATGSIADVKAKGIWGNDMWTLEMGRSLNTGNEDDAVFSKGQTIQMAIAAFNDVDGKKHSVSDILTLTIN